LKGFNSITACYRNYILYLNTVLVTIQCFSSIVPCTTAPNHSRRNLVERIMSLVNIGLQCVGVMRSKISDETEEKLKTATI